MTATNSSEVKFGLLPSPQYTSWEAMREVAREMDRLGYASLWCSDHLIAPYPWTLGPAFEAYTTLAGWAAVTENVQLGAMVSAAGFRNPALLVKMITTIDHISGGRAVLGIGAGWFEDEHRAFGYEFGSPAERVDRLAEALHIIRGMLDDTAPSGQRIYQHEAVRNLPPPVQSRLKVLVGGRGDRMLGLVARYADAWNLAGPMHDVADKEQRLRASCARIGRDPSSIERTYHAGPVFIRDRVEDADEAAAERFAVHGIEGVTLQLVGPPERIAAQLAPFVQLGFRHIYFDLISPYDQETLVRLADEVKPMLDALDPAQGELFPVPAPEKERPVTDLVEDRQPTVANLVQNSGFEEAVDEYDNGPPGWSMSVGDPEADRWTIDSEVTAGGEGSLRLEPRQHCVAVQTLPGPFDDLDAKTVKFSVDIRQDHAAGPAVVQLIAFNPDGPVDPMLKVGVAGWTQVVVAPGREGSFRTYRGKFVAKSAATHMQLTLTAAGPGGSHWFDNAVVHIED